MLTYSTYKQSQTSLKHSYTTKQTIGTFTLILLAIALIGLFGHYSELPLLSQLQAGI